VTTSVSEARELNRGLLRQRGIHSFSLTKWFSTAAQEEESPKLPRRGLEPHVERLEAATLTRSIGKIDRDDRDKQHAENGEYVHVDAPGQIIIGREMT
jgi:hypothetical protein